MAAQDAEPITADTLPAVDERQRVEDWRLHELLRAGYHVSDALLLATAADIDLHAAVGLIRGGCPTETAARILL